MERAVDIGLWTSGLWRGLWSTGSEVRAEEGCGERAVEAAVGKRTGASHGSSETSLSRHWVAVRQSPSSAFRQGDPSFVYLPRGKEGGGQLWEWAVKGAVDRAVEGGSGEGCGTSCGEQA